MRATICTILMVFVLVLTAWAGAETIYLKDGSRMAGKIVGAADDSIRFETSHGVLVIMRDEIERIEYDSPVAGQGRVQNSPAVPTPTPPAAKKSIAESVVGENPENKPASIPPTQKKPAAILGAGYRFASDESEGGPQASFGLLAPVSEAVLVGGGIGFAHFNNKVKTLSKGTVTLIPVTARIELRSQGGAAFGAGLGYAFASHGLDPEVESLAASFGFGIEEELKGAFTAEASLGFAARTSETTKVGISVGYQFLEPKGEATVTDLASGNFVTVKFDAPLSAPFIRAHLDF